PVGAPTGFHRSNIKAELQEKDGRCARTQRGARQLFPRGMQLKNIKRKEFGVATTGEHGELAVIIFWDRGQGHVAETVVGEDLERGAVGEDLEAELSAERAGRHLEIFAAEVPGSENDFDPGYV